jgi:hypothetical protein
VSSDAIWAIIAAGIAAIVAGVLTRGPDPAEPGWAVRIYMLLFRASNIPQLRDVPSKRTRFPRREAFLATWFLLFFAIFFVGLFLWPEARRP